MKLEYSFKYRGAPNLKIGKFGWVLSRKLIHNRQAETVRLLGQFWLVTELQKQKCI